MSRHRKTIHVEQTIRPKRVWLNQKKQDASAFMIVTGEADIYEPRNRKSAKSEYHTDDVYFSGNIKISDCYKSITLDIYGEEGEEKLDFLIQQLEDMREKISVAKEKAREKYVHKMTKKHGKNFNPKTLELDWDAIEAEEKAKEKQKSHNKKQKDRAG